MTRRVRIGNHSLKVPGSPRARRLLGAGLIIGGILGFLPILGFWMVPLGLLILSIDSSIIRRWRRRMEVKHGAWLKKRYPRIAGLFGLANNGNGNNRKQD
jgi:hypothetical protein